MAIPAAKYYPLAQGDRWQYRHTVSGAASPYGEPSTYQTIVTTGAPRSEGGREIWPLTTKSTSPAEADSVSEMVATTRALSEVVGFDAELGMDFGDLDLIRYPMSEGGSYVALDKTVQRDLNGDGVVDTFSLKVVVTTVGIESVEVPAGRFGAALHVRSQVSSRFQDGHTRSTDSYEMVTKDWYAPDVGLIKSVTALADSEGSPLETEELVSYRVGGVSSDRVAPTAFSASPAEGVLYAAPIEFTVQFDEVLWAGSVSSGSLGLRTSTGQDVPGVTVLRGDTSLVFTPSQPLSNGDYTLLVKAEATDVAGNAVSARTYSYQIPDRVPPALASSSPARDATGVDPGAVVDLYFSEPLEPSSIEAANAVIVNVAGYTFVPFTLEITGANSIRLSPQVRLAYGATYIVQISGMRDLAGNHYPEAVHYRFTTGPDSGAPVLVNIDPAPGATDRPWNTTVTFEFDEALSASSVIPSAFQWRHAVTGATVPFGVQHVAPNRVVLVPSVLLTSDTPYMVDFQGLMDLAGNAVARSGAASFRTFADRAPPALLSTDPAQGAIDRPLNTTVTFDFDEALSAASVTASAFQWRHAVSGAPVAFTVQQVTPTRVVLTPSGTLANDTPYAVDFSLQDLAGNTVARSNAATFRTLADREPPVLFSAVPAVQDSFVARDSTVTLRFNEPMDASSLVAGNFTWRETIGGANLPFALSVVDSRTVRLTPQGLMRSSTGYYIGYSGVRDAAGNSAAQPVAANFTTQALLPGGMNFGSAAQHMPPPNSGVQAVVLRDPTTGSNWPFVISVLPSGTGSSQAVVMLQDQMSADGRTTFGAGSVGTLPSGCGGQGLAVGDFNGDGLQDIAIGSSDCGKLTMLWRNPANSPSAFTTTHADAAHVYQLKVRDMNGDGIDDVVGRSAQGSGLQLWLGSASGSLSAPQNIPLSYSDGGELALGDVNGDGRIDIVLSGVSSGLGTVQRLLRQADGSFAPGATVEVGVLPGALSLALHDENRDGRLDLLVHLSAHAMLAVYRQGLDGEWGAPTLRTSRSGRGLLLADLDGDLVPDLAIGSAGDAVTIHRGLPDGGFDAPLRFSTGYAGSTLPGLSGPYVGLADFNRDGRPDIYLYGKVVMFNQGPAAAPTAAGLSRVKAAGSRWWKTATRLSGARN